MMLENLGCKFFGALKVVVNFWKIRNLSIS